MSVTPTMPTRRVRVVAAAIAGAAIVALAGCAPAPATPEGPTSIAIGIPADVTPATILQKVQANFPVRSLVFDTLVTVDPQSGDVVPVLAESWEPNEDFSAFSFKLRGDVEFHDGSPLTAEDVVFSLTAAMDPAGTPVQSLVQTIASIEATADDEVTITLKRPMASFPTVLCDPIIIDEASFAGLKDGTTVVGTGPYLWTTWTPGTSLELTANADYWGGEPSIDDVSLQVLNSSQAMESGLQSGLVDALTQVVPKDAAGFADAGDYTVVSAAPVFTEWALFVNTAVAPLDDVRVRQALAYAIDRDRIVDQVFGGTADASSIPANDDLPGVSDDQTEHYQYDPDRAAELLADAGAEGATIKIYSNAANQTLTAMMEIIQFDLTEAGFTVETHALDAAAYQEQGRTGYDGIWLSPTDGLSRSLQSSALFGANLGFQKNTSNFTSEEYTELSEAMLEAEPGDDLAAATHDWLDYYIEQAFRIPLVHSYYLGVTTSDVAGLAYNGTAELDLRAAEVTG